MFSIASAYYVSYNTTTYDQLLAISNTTGIDHTITYNTRPTDGQGGVHVGIYEYIGNNEYIIVPNLLRGEKTDMEKVNKICDRLGISDRLKHLPSEISGGQQQRAAIARALINDPELLLCDEPTGNLDSKTSAEVADILSEINHSMKKTIIMVTHDMNMASRADVIYTISDGRIVDR